MKFSKNLQELRTSRGLSQEQLADKIGVSRQAIGAWESGKTMPEIDKVAQICKVFEVSADELLGELSSKESQKPKFSKSHYERENSQISILKATGVAMILFGVATTLLQGAPETANNTNGLLAKINEIHVIFGVILALPMFILGNNKDEIIKNRLKSARPTVSDIYSDQELEEIKTRKAIFSSLGVTMIVASVAIFAILGAHSTLKENQIIGIMIATISVGVWNLIFGAQNDKVEKIHDLHREKNPELEKFFAILWALTVGIYLITGFIFGSWRVLWVIFPIASVVTGVVSIIFKKKK